MPSPKLAALLNERLDLMRERDALRGRLQEVVAQIDELIDAERGEQLLNQLSARDRDLMVQTVRTRGIRSKEAVNG